MTPFQQKMLSESLEVHRKWIAADTTIQEISQCAELPKNVQKLIEVYRQELKGKRPNGQND